MDLVAQTGFRRLAMSVTLVLIMLTMAVPARAWFRERRDISVLKTTLAAQQAAVDELTTKKQRLNDKAYLEALVRARLNWVYPGEVGFVVLDKETSTQIKSVPGALVPNSDAPWYSKLWTSTKLADQPRAKNDPLVVGAGKKTK
jgi:cell division protein FtsB